MTKEQVKLAAAATTPQQAYDEAMRELEVRSRCYPKWLKEGKLSHTDCSTRFAAQAMIVRLLADLPTVTANAESTSTEWKPF